MLPTPDRGQLPLPPQTTVLYRGDIFHTDSYRMGYRVLFRLPVFNLPPSAAMIIDPEAAEAEEATLPIYRGGETQGLARLWEYSNSCTGDGGEAAAVAAKAARAAAEERAAAQKEAKAAAKAAAVAAKAAVAAEAAAQAAAEAQAAATNGTEANGTEANGTAVSAVAATKGRGRDESDDDSDDVSSPLAPPLEPSLAFAPWLKWFGTTRSSQLSPWLAHGCLSPRKVWGLATNPHQPRIPSRSVILHFKLL